MSVEESSKFRNTLWWITSIAVSVLCCSVLFVLFASYLVDMKEDLRENSMRISALQESQNRLMTSIEMMSKRLPPAPAAATAPATVSPDATAAPTPVTGDAPASVTVPVMQPETPAKP